MSTLPPCMLLRLKRQPDSIKNSTLNWVAGAVGAVGAVVGASVTPAATSPILGLVGFSAGGPVAGSSFSL
jgi:hypothetical protein